MNKNLTSGNPLKLLFKFSIPVLISGLIQQLYSIIDSIFIGKFAGTNALAGVTASSFLIFLIFGFLFGISSGCAIILARKFGAKSKPGMKLCVASSLHILLLISIVFTIVGVLSATWSLKMLSTPAEILNHARTYTLINYSGIFAMMAYNMFSQLLRSLGDNNAALFFLICACVLNVALDALFVIVFDFAVAGAAFATVISETISGVCCAIYMFKKYRFICPTKRYLKFNRTFFFAQLKLGVPIAFETSVCCIGLLILQRAINELGPAFVAGFGIAMRIEDLLIVTILALSTSASVFTAQNFGAKKFKRIKKGTSSALLISLAFCALFILLFLTSWDFFVQLFIDKATPLNEIAQVKLAAKRYIDITLLHYPVLCGLIILRNIIQSLGKTLIPVCGGFIELVARAFGAFVLGKFFHYDGICFATILAWWAAFIPMVFSYLNNIRKLIKNPKPFQKNDP